MLKEKLKLKSKEIPCLPNLNKPHYNIDIEEIISSIEIDFSIFEGEDLSLHESFFEKITDDLSKVIFDTYIYLVPKFGRVFAVKYISKIKK